MPFQARYGNKINENAAGKYYPAVAVPQKTAIPSPNIPTF